MIEEVSVLHDIYVVVDVGLTVDVFNPAFASISLFFRESLGPHQTDPESSTNSHNYHVSCIDPVSYTHLTLPTIYSV